MEFWRYFFGIMLVLTAAFLILVILVQRGRGGGLAGALGGMGGQSAFGTKAGDTFTRITFGVAAFWILLCIATVKVFGIPEGRFSDTEPSTQTTEEALPPLKEKGEQAEKQKPKSPDAAGSGSAKDAAGSAKLEGAAKAPSDAKPAEQPPAPTERKKD